MVSVSRTAWNHLPQPRSQRHRSKCRPFGLRRIADSDGVFGGRPPDMRLAAIMEIRLVALSTADRAVNQKHGRAPRPLDHSPSTLAFILISLQLASSVRH